MTKITMSSIQGRLCVILSAGIVGLIFGFTLPLFAIIMENDSIDITLIGLSAATESLAIIFVGPFIPKLFSFLGIRKSMFYCIGIGTVVIVLIAFSDPLYAWFPLRFILGACVYILLIASDLWISQETSSHVRGRVIAIYGISVTSGMAAGPLLLPTVGSDGYIPILVSAAILATASIPLLLVSGNIAINTPKKPIKMRPFLRTIPLLLIAVFAFGIIESSALTMVPIYGLHLGLNETKALILLTLFITGSIILQLPLGWISDRIDRYYILKICTILGLCSSIALLFLFKYDWALWLCLFLIGGTIAGTYTLSLAIIGDLYNGVKLATAISLFAMIFAIGSTLGPIASGYIMRLWDPHGLILVLVIAFGLIWSASNSKKMFTESNT